MLQFFLNRNRGSITVFVTVIMIPVVFFTGFMVDLSRIKFCGNQAVMAADNYGEAILTDYDNLLKELYGLFALSQNKEGTEALDRLDAYVKEYHQTSFKPNEKRISFGHLKEFTGTKEYEGWMPYQNAQVEMSAKPAAGATLASPEVFNTQIGDFMKFRIVQAVGDDEDAVADAIGAVQDMSGNIEAADKRTEIGEKAGQVLQLAQSYYAKLEAISQYGDYIRALNDAYSEGTAKMDNEIAFYYPPYRDYQIAGPDEVEAALEHRARIEEAAESGEAEESEGEDAEEEKDTLSAEEEALCVIGDAYYDASVYPMDSGLESLFENDRNPVKVYFKRDGQLMTTFSGGYVVYDGDGDTQTVINFENFASRVRELQSIAGELNGKMDDLSGLRSELNTILSRDDVSDSLKQGMKKEMEQADSLFIEGEKYSASNYLELAYFFDGNISQNEAYREQAEKMFQSMETVADECVNQHLDAGALSAYEDKLDLNRWSRFADNDRFKRLYESLRECFGDISEASNNAKKKQKEADNLLESVGDKLKEDENQTTARDIPPEFGMGDGAKSGSFDITRMIRDSGTAFSSSSLVDAGNRLWTKFYLTQYDLGMFSSRVTNVQKSDGGEQEDAQREMTEESLTGYPMAPNINYLYQAEIEYLLGGHNSSKENLNEARNKILAFRSAMNLVATYTVEEIDIMIREVASAASAVNPLLGLVVAGALRLAVAGVETYADWILLKDRKGVCVFKTKMQDLSVSALPEDMAGSLNSMLETTVSSGSEASSAFKLDYEQYLLVMMIFLIRSETLSARSANLITLNVNTVKQKIGSEGSLGKLTFKMKDTVTAVDVTCGVQMDMVVMPKGFAKAAASESLYEAIERFEDHTYRYTVTRGY